MKGVYSSEGQQRLCSLDLEAHEDGLRTCEVDGLGGRAGGGGAQPLLTPTIHIKYH